MNQKLLKTWLDAHQPLAVEKLAVASRVSSSLIRQMMKGRAPRSTLVRSSLAQTLGVSEPELFPAGKRKTA